MYNVKVNTVIELLFFYQSKISFFLLFLRIIFMNAAYLCLGGNIGDREVFLLEAVKRIGEQAGPVKQLSSIYETEAWGVSGQQAYLNRCISIETALAPEELLRVLLSIEQELGRTRDPWKTYEPRTIDIDILLYDDVVLEQEHLILPHPRLHLRKFVLIPLNEIAGAYLHPVLNKSIFNLLGECQDSSEVVLYQKA
jgi:2-amino-4-hydroxy-6-hydroxymethyldihydropteridine diphosphokinase